MNYSEQENFHNSSEDNCSYDEINRQSNEYLNSKDENDKSEEFSDFLLQNNSKPSQKKTEENSNNLRKYLSLVACTVTATTVIAVPALISPTPTPTPEPPPPPLLSTVSEDIGLTTYSCVLSASDNDFDLQIVLTDSSGEQQTITAKKENGEYKLNFDDLEPETEYTLEATNQSGEERYVDTFSTEPFIYLEQEANGKINFALHPEIAQGTDMGLELISESGGDFRSNVFLDYEFLFDSKKNYIILDGLYNEIYDLRLLMYLLDVDEPIIYQKQLNLGVLTKLEYEVEFRTPEIMTDTPGTEVYAKYISGEVAPYSIVEISLENTQTGRYYFYDTIEVDQDNNIILILPEEIEAGNYIVTISGVLETEEYSLYNEIWKGETLNAFEPNNTIESTT